MGLRQCLEGKDREIRAKNFAEMAVYTVVLSFSLRVIIAFEIEGLGHPEHIARAVVNTEFAALAPLSDHSDPTPCDLNGLQVKRNTPIFHLKIPLVLPDGQSFWGFHPGKKKSVTLPDRYGMEARYKFA